MILNDLRTVRNARNCFNIRKCFDKTRICREKIMKFNEVYMNILFFGDLIYFNIILRGTVRLEKELD